MLRKAMFISAVSALCALVAGCASGPKVSESGAIKQTVPNGKSQIIVYRTSLLGAAVQPAVLLDGRRIGACAPNGAFNAFVSPGPHQLSATTEVTETINVNAPAGRTAYVKCSIWFGFFIGRPAWEEVPPSIGANEIQSLSFTGAVIPDK